MSEEIFIERMTWPEVRDAIAGGKRRVLIMLGAMEQHGPHLPIGTDTFLGYETGERLARAFGDALVAPILTLGYSPGHMCYAGTVTLPEELVTDLACHVGRSMAEHGFEEIDLVPTHGGNYRAAAAAVRRLRQELPDKRVAGFASFEPWAEWYRDFAESHDLEPVRFGVHAAQAETSAMMASQYRDLVRTDHFAEGFLGDPSIRWRAAVPPPMDSMSPTGILGDARNSSTELGETYFGEKIPELARRLRAGGDPV